MLFCEVSKVVGWKSQVDLCNVFVPAAFANFGLVLIGLLYCCLLQLSSTLAYFLWSVDVREYYIYEWEKKQRCEWEIEGDP